MKIDRLLGIVTLLLQREKTTAPELAQRFEVSRRTINRDIESLCKAGIPVVCAQGYGGGLSLAPGYKIDKTLFTRDELQSVLTGLAGLDSVSSTPRLKAVREKLSGPDSSLLTQDNIVIDLASHYGPALTQTLETLRQAIERRCTVMFCYASQAGEGLRSVEPHRLVFRWEAWYLLGFCLDRQAFRLFKLTRLWALHLTDTPFCQRPIPPQSLCAQDYFHESRFHLQAIFSPCQRHRLIDAYGVDCFRTLESGGLLLERDFSSYAYLREWVFSFGDKVRVLAPATLRAERRQHAENILRQSDAAATV